MDTRLYKELRANQYFLVNELEKRGIEVKILDQTNELLAAQLNDHRELLLNIDSSCMNYPASVVSGHKAIAKKLLSAQGISVPRGDGFFAEEKEKALKLATEIGYPVVLKPSFGVQGEDVYINIEYPSEVATILDDIVLRHGNIPMVIEEYFAANEYRIFVTAKGPKTPSRCAVLLRDPASITGNGKDKIADLVERENIRRTSPRSNCLCPILIDDIATSFLRKNGRSLHDIPAVGEKVYLRPNSNVKTGGMCEDMTALTHPSVIKIAQQTLKAFPGMPYAGIDFMTADISKAQSCNSYRLIEVNSLPGIGIHMAPGKGEKRNVASWLVDLIFPETACTYQTLQGNTPNIPYLMADNALAPSSSYTYGRTEDNHNY